MAKPSGLPEPEPYDIEPAVAERARRWLFDASTGRIDPSQLDSRIADVWTEELAQKWLALLGPLGEPLDFYPFQIVADANAVQYFFRVRYPLVTMTWVFSVTPSGEVNGFGLRESWNKRLASIALRDVTGY
jgi:hypothetical protein